MRVYSSPNLTIVIGALLVSGCYLAVEFSVAGSFGLPLDDSWIHLQFARQVASGNGLAFNPGEPVGGSTSLLWTSLLAIGFAVIPGTTLLFWAKLLGCLCFSLACLATGTLARQLGLSDRNSALAGLLVAATPWLAWSAVSGMEVCLFAWLSIAGLTLHLRELDRPESSPRSLFVLGLAALARPEGLLLITLALADRWRARRLSTKEVLIAAILIAPTIVVYGALNGTPLPTTFSSKGASLERLLPNRRFLGLAIGILFESQPITLLLAAGGALALLAGRASRVIVALWPISLLVVYSLLAPGSGSGLVGNFGRYLFPLVPPIVVLGVVALGSAQRQLRPSVVKLLVVTIFVPQLFASARGPSRYLQTRANVDDSVVAAAAWLGPRLPSSATLAAQDIGALKYHLPNRVLDLAGITNPEIVEILRDPSSSYWEDRLLTYLRGQQPDYLVVYPRSYPRLTSSSGFSIVHAFDVTDNVTMAGNQLVIFETPWNRHPLGQVMEPSGSLRTKPRTKG